MKEIIIFPFDLSSEFRDEDYIQGREMDLLQPGFTIGPKSFCSSTKIWYYKMPWYFDLTHFRG